MERKKKGRPSKDRPAMPNALSIRGSAEWRDWLARYAAFKRVKPTEVIDLVLDANARRDKFEPPPPRI